MAVYLGSNKVKIILNKDACRLNVPVTPSNTDSIKLLSADNYILTDFNGLYLIPKEGEE